VTFIAGQLFKGSLYFRNMDPNTISVASFVFYSSIRIARRDRRKRQADGQTGGCSARQADGQAGNGQAGRWTDGQVNR